MPLSDAARRLLAAKTGQAPPADLPPEPEPAADTPPPTEEQAGFRERARREEERFRLATDSEYWVALCFRTPEAVSAFTSALNLDCAGPAGRYVPGPMLEQALAHRPAASLADRARRMLQARRTNASDVTAQLSASPVPDPIAALEQSGDLSADTQAECAALLAALTASPDPQPPSVLDSPHWLIAYWPSRDPKDAWLAAIGLDVLGDKYLDGHQAARILDIALPA